MGASKIEFRWNILLSMRMKKKKKPGGAADGRGHKRFYISLTRVAAASVVLGPVSIQPHECPPELLFSFTVLGKLNSNVHAFVLLKSVLWRWA